MKRRQILTALGAGAFTLPLGSLAQQPAKIYRIGFLDAASASSRAERAEWIRAGLRDLGYVEGKNIVIEFRWADGKYERLAELAQELARLKVDVLITIGTPCTVAAKQATSTIPIVMVSVGDPIAAGIVTSLAHPEGNATGLAMLSPELTQKTFELCKEALPRTTQVAFLLNPSNASHANNYKAAEIAAKALKINLQKFEAGDLEGIKTTFSAMKKQGTSAVVILQDPMFGPNHTVIAVLAETYHIASFGPAEFAAAGGMIGLGALQSEMSRRVGYFVDKILRGAKPADIPVERPIKFEMIVNLKTAKTLAVKIPNSIMVRATKVIE